MFKILGSDGKEYGPVTRGNVIEWIRDGRANLQTKACRSDETEWKTLGDFPEFVPTGTAPSLVSLVPPPLPPAEEVASATPEILPEALPIEGLRRAGPWRTCRAVPEIPEALPLAGLRLRFAAALVDGFLQWVCWMPAAMALSTALTEQMTRNETPSFETLINMSASAMPKSLPYLAVLALVQITLLCLRSQSVGKILLRIQIVSVRDNQPGGPIRSFLLRGLPTWIIKQIPLLGLLYWLADSFCIFREDQRCIHDLIAGTKVVKLK